MQGGNVGGLIFRRLTGAVQGGPHGQGKPLVEAVSLEWASFNYFLLECLIAACQQGQELLQALSGSCGVQKLLADLSG